VNNFSAIKYSFKLLTQNSKKKLVFATLGQFIISFLDVIGISLISLLVFVASNNKLPDLPVIREIRVQDLDTVKIILLITIMLFFTVKAVLSLTLFSFTLGWLFKNSSYYSKSLLRNIFQSQSNFYSKFTASDFAFVCTHGVTALVGDTLSNAIVLFSEYAFLLLMISILIYVNPVLSISIILFFIIITVAMGTIVKSKQKFYAESRARESVLGMNQVQFMSQSIRDISVYKKLNFFLDSFSTSRDNNAQASAKLQFLGLLPKYIYETTFYLALCILIMWVNLKHDASSFVEISFLLAAGSRMIPSLLRAQSANLGIRSAVGASAGTRQLLNQLEKSTAQVTPSDSDPSRFWPGESRKRDNSLIDSPNPLDEVLAIKAMTFSHSGRGDWKLKIPDFSLKVGERLLIIGPSGVGKSTVADLILGMLQPNSGHVRINGKIKSSHESTLDVEVAYVPQSISMWPGTLLENIAFGIHPHDIDRDRVEKIVERVQLSEWVNTLPKGIDSGLGVNGTELSGGQKQRIALARALYFEARLLILDEPTSALDKANSAKIVDLLNELNEKSAMVIITHNSEISRSGDFIYDVATGSIESQD